MKLILLRYLQAWDALKRNPSLVITVVITMGITVGVLLCVLTLAYFIEIKPLPYPEQEQLYRLEHVIHNKEGNENARAFSYPGMVDLYKKQSVFDLTAMISYADDVMSSSSTQPNLKIAYVTPEWFEILQVPMVIGRNFEQSEGIDQNNPVAILNYATWLSEFSKDPEILDKTIEFSGVSFRIVGVISPNFVEPEIYQTGRKTQVVLPWDFNQSVRLKERWANIDDSLILIGKLKKQISATQAEQIITPMVSDTWQENLVHIDFFNGWKVKMHLTSFKDAILGDVRSTIILLIIGVVAIILIALANISNLLMSRTAEQQKSLAIRASLGATRRDLFLTLFMETSLLMMFSIIIALIISQFGFYILKDYLYEVLPRIEELGMNLFTLTSAFIIVFALAMFLAALSTRIIDYKALNSSLQSSGKGTGIQVSKFRRQLLIATQVTIAMLLVFVNLSILNSSLDTINEPSGFFMDDSYDMELSYSSSSWPSRGELVQNFDRLQDELTALPVIKSVIRSSSPFQNFRNWAITETVTNTQFTPYRKSVDSGYFEAIGQPLIEGRFFSQQDIRDNNKVVIINDVFAKELSPEGNALGMRVSPDGDVQLEIIGIVKGVKIPGSESIPSRIYTTTTLAQAEMIIRLHPGKHLSRESVVETLKNVNPMFTLYRLESFTSSRNKRLFAEYTSAITTSVLAIFSFFLGSIGIYGVLSYGTHLRKIEIGTRMALGASQSRILRMIVADNTTPIVTGIAISFISLVFTYLMYSSTLYDFVSLSSFGLLAISLVLVIGVSLTACYIPLRKYFTKPVSYALRGN